MKVDLLHNSIIRDTITPRFIKSVSENLTSLIEDIYTDAVGILMYEDYIDDGFLSGGRWFYPLTVKRRDAVSVVWVSWSYNGEYFSRSPYSYEGQDLLEFSLAEYVPEEFIRVAESRAHDYDESALPISVERDGGDPLILCGRYSQTFIDTLASQITKEISTRLAIEGLTNSDISLELVFSGNSYMEHTSENVTYRRLLMVDGASKPRDFWVRWTNIVGDNAYSVSDHVSPDEILFEIGEDVAHKIREKEYRFLCSSDPSVYQAAIGKRAATEWRDLIKRAVRRGQVTKLESELVIKERERDDELRDRLTGLLGDSELPEAASVSVPEAEGFDSLMDLVRAALVKSEEHSAADDGFDFGDGLSGIDLGIGEDAPSAEADIDSDLGGEGGIFDVVEEALGTEEDVIAEDEGGEIESDEEGNTVEDELPEDSREEEDAEGLEEAESDDIIDEPEEEIESAEDEIDDVTDAPESEEDEIDDVTDAPESEEDDVEEDVDGQTDEQEPDDESESLDDDGHLSLEELLRRVEESFREAEAEEAEPTVEPEPVAEKITQFTTDNDTVADTDEDITDEEVVTEEVIESEEEIYEGKVGVGAYPDEDSIRRELEAKIRLEYEAEARARAEAEIARLIEEASMLREENERLARAARSAEEQHARALSDNIESEERARAAEQMLERAMREREREEARERDRLAEAARIAVEERRRREEEERAALEERLAREAEERAEAERLAEEARLAREEEERLERERLEAEAREAERIARENEFISKRAKIIFRTAVDVNVISRIRAIVEQTIRDNQKQHIRIHMKAYQEDKNIIVLDVLKMPRIEQDLLVSIVKAIGNARIGVTKIILE